MFDTIEEKQAKKIINDILPPRIKQIFASTVYCGMKIAGKICMEHPELPKLSRYDAGCQLRFIISYLLTKIADNELTARLTYTETRGNSSPDYWWDSRIKIQVKKNDKSEALPKKSFNRTSNAKSNQGSLFTIDEFSECYVLVTYDHKDFNCTYIQIGIPDAKYERWLDIERIENYIDTDTTEYIEKNYGKDLEAALSDEKITKQFNLTINE
ncbi:hypothetical protein [Phascolarctobacterium succinatutens]|jgi:hypothetical protein|uniref:hypothetical protein n=1 Tax=Phascolarctobacterium succinatutens TaxID=626940 RepID=UPI00307F4FED